MPTPPPDAAPAPRRSRLPRLAALLFGLLVVLAVALPLAARQIIGPTRLNYARVVPMVDYTARVVGRLLG